MKKILAVLAFVFACLWGTAFAADFSHLVILHTNDTHGYDQRADGVNGMATVAALKKDYEAKGYKVLLVDAGDAIQDNNLVNFSKGKTAIDFMNAVGYDAMTIGNHEFDWGVAKVIDTDQTMRDYEIDGKKHKNDIFRLFASLPGNVTVMLTPGIESDVRQFLSKIQDEEIDLQALRIRGQKSEILSGLHRLFGM